MYCKKCGNFIDQGSDFCRICGTTVPSNSPQQPATNYSESTDQNQWSSAQYQQPTPQQQPAQYQQPTPQQRHAQYQQPTPQQRPTPYQQPAPQQQPAQYQQPAPQQQPTPYQQPTPQQQPAQYQQPTPQQQPTQYQQPPAQYPQYSTNPYQSNSNVQTQQQKKPSKGLIIGIILAVVALIIIIVVVVRPSGSDALVGRWHLGGGNDFLSFLGSNIEVEFFPDGTVDFNFFTHIESGTWSADRNYLTIRGVVAEFSGTFPYRVSGNTLTITMQTPFVNLFTFDIELTRIR